MPDPPITAIAESVLMLIELSRVLSALKLLSAVLTRNRVDHSGVFHGHSMDFTMSAIAGAARKRIARSLARLAAAVRMISTAS